MCVISFWVPFIHGDLDQRIAAITKKIALSPGDATLYMQRGDLYLQHEEFKNAKNDYAYCLHHELNIAHVLSGLSTAYYYLHQPDSALFFIEEVILLEPGNIMALDIKVSILESIGKYCEAAEFLEKTILLAPDPTPSMFLHLSANWKHCDAGENIERSIQVLHEGMEALHNNYILHSQLITLYINYNRFEEALIWQTKLIERSPSKPRAYLQRAEIFLSLNNKVTAIQDLATALGLIEKMAPQKRDLPAIRELKAEIEQLKYDLEK